MVITFQITNKNDLGLIWKGEGNRTSFTKGFSDSSVGKESACNAGDPALIPGLRRPTGEGIGHPLQYSWVSLVAELVKNPLAMQKTWVRSLGWEDPVKKGKATHSSILAWRIPWTSPWGHKESDMTERFQFTTQREKAAWQARKKPGLGT